MLSAFKTTYRNCWNCLWKHQLFSALLFSLAIIIAQVSPMQAGHFGLGNSEFIEICGGEDGSYLIEVSQNSEDSEQGHDCNDCSLCTVSGNGANVAPAKGSVMFQMAFAVELAFLQDCKIFTDCPEKHWSASRAPPKISTKRNPIFSNSFYLIRLHKKYSEGAQISQVGSS